MKKIRITRVLVEAHIQQCIEMAKEERGRVIKSIIAFVFVGLVVSFASIRATIIILGNSEYLLVSTLSIGVTMFILLLWIRIIGLDILRLNIICKQIYALKNLDN